MAAKPIIGAMHTIHTPRPDYLLYPQRQPAPLLDASTLLLLRDLPVEQGGGWEVLMTRRSDKASFLPGAYVFPGGGIEPQDSESGDWLLCRPQIQADAEQLRFALAALRENFEEMGLLLAVDGEGQPISPAQLAALDRQAPLWPQLQAQGLRLDARGVWQLAHWSADPIVDKRFAVPFFIARMPEGQTPIADESEQFEPVWVQAAHALAEHEAGRMPMIYPTIHTLKRLARFATVQEMLDAVQDGELWRSMPRSGQKSGDLYRCTQEDQAYGELMLVCPDGRPKHHLDWQSQQPVPLRKNLLRLTAPNASVMTGPGTNSYLLGEAATGYIAIDPGPDDPAHIQRLFDAAGGDIRHIVCTHSHPDHSPGAWLLQALCQQQGRDKPLVYGLASAPDAPAHSAFVPDSPLPDGAQLRLQGSLPNGQPTSHSLLAIHTPGHTANHLCLLLLEDGLLFTGDHILNGSTTIINPPDGHMGDYLDSLERLDTLCAQHQVQFLLPAHGYAMYDAQAIIAQLRAHRLAREAKVLAAMRQAPQGSLQDWVALAYADTPSALWPLAERSLQAHVQRIEALGLLQ